jgi:ribosomal protein L16 Arg81 hydroxylase
MAKMKNHHGKPPITLKGAVGGRYPTFYVYLSTYLWKMLKISQKNNRFKEKT